MSLITTTDELALACQRLARFPFVTVDTEFLRETTFWPILCLVQLASDEEALAIDALAPGIDLEPLLQLMADEDVVKVFHAARQDLEIFWKLSGVLPTPLFDTQVAAMVCGYGEQVSYSELAQSICHVGNRQVVAVHRLGAPPAGRGADRLCDRRRDPSARDLQSPVEAGRGRRAPILARRRDEDAELAFDLRAASRARLGALQEQGAQAARSRGADGARGLARERGAGARRAPRACAQGRRV